MIRREEPGTRRVQVLSADLRCGLARTDVDANPRLAPRDRILRVRPGNGPACNPRSDPPGTEAAGGERRAVAGRACLGPSASPRRVSARAGHDRQRPDSRRRWTCRGSLRRRGRPGALRGSGRTDAQDGRRQGRPESRPGTRTAADLALAPFDFLVVKEISQWSAQETVRLEGEVRFPGEYPIERGETLRSVIGRAGGLTPLAFPQGSVFTRESLKERERRQVEMLADRLKQDLGTLALQATQAPADGAQQASETLAIGQSLLADLRNARAGGTPRHRSRPGCWPRSRTLQRRRDSQGRRHSARAADRAGGDGDRRGAESDIAPVRPDAGA